MTRFRVFTLLLAGLFILGLVVFRERQLANWPRQTAPASLVQRRPALGFELEDHRQRVLKLQGFLGRERIILVFFDDALGADRDPRLLRLYECREVIQRSGWKVMAISGATPFANLQAEERLGFAFPFPVLTDIERRPAFDAPLVLPVHHQWGRFDERAGKPRSGVFLIGRDGTITADSAGVPLPVADEGALFDALCRGEWPDR